MCLFRCKIVTNVYIWWVYSWHIQQYTSFLRHVYVTTHPNASISFLVSPIPPIRYRIEKTPTLIIASLSVGFCDTSQPGKCLKSIDILKESAFPIPTCSEDASLFWEDCELWVFSSWNNKRIFTLKKCNNAISGKIILYGIYILLKKIVWCTFCSGFVPNFRVQNKKCIVNQNKLKTINIIYNGAISVRKCENDP